ncbi:12178_t:CDS:2, partial [Ambispora leptoticha]
LHQHVLRCSDWPASEKAIYLQKIAEESLAPRKRAHDNEDDTSAEQDSENTHQQSTHLHQNMIGGHLLTKMFSNHFQEKLNMLPSLTDLTVSLDRWTDNSRNSIYGFIALKERQEIVLDILDLSAHRHTSDFLKEKVKEVLLANGIQISSAIFIITDNASNMDKMRRILNEEYPNIIPIRCCLHVFNLIVKDINYKAGKRIKKLNTLWQRFVKQDGILLLKFVW